MILVADESVDGSIIQQLRIDGYTVLAIAEMEPSISDEVVMQRANEQNALLLTGDKDFGEIVFRLKQLNGGVVLLRLAGLNQSIKVDIVSTAFSNHAMEFIEAFTVISPGSIRIRRKD